MSTMMDMLDLLFISGFGAVLVFFLVFISEGVALNFEEGEKSYSLESGFISVGGGLSFFSLQFFVFLIVFIIFDLEVLFLLGVLFIKEVSSFLLIIFIVFVILTLWLEWYWGQLSWGK